MLEEEPPPHPDRSKIRKVSKTRKRATKREYLSPDKDEDIRHSRGRAVSILEPPHPQREFYPEIGAPGDRVAI